MTRPALALVLLGLAGCGPLPPGAVTGDAFLVEDVGREVNLAGLEVRLLAEAEQLDSTLARICPTREVPPPVTLERHQRAWVERARILAPLVTATVHTDERARFQFRDVPPGRYRLWADTTVGRVRWTWLQPVRVLARETSRVELSNANPDENPFRCGPRDPAPTPLTTKTR